MVQEIPFYRPHLTGRENDYLRDAIERKAIASDGLHSAHCVETLEAKLGLSKVLLTSSGTVALEMAARLLDLEAGDEVIMPSFTFSSTANAVVLCGAQPVFVDVEEGTLNIDPAAVERAISERTRAIFVVHYAGVACDMARLSAIAEQHGIPIVEDAAQAVGASHEGRALGSFGRFGAYSFHYTKNFMSGEGGALAVNNPKDAVRAEIFREKGTNRMEFMRGQVDFYTWVDIGSSCLPSELTCAFLRAQLEEIDEITRRRSLSYDYYRQSLAPLSEHGAFELPRIPDYAGSNFHQFHIILSDRQTRDGLTDYLKGHGITAAFHFVPLHASPMGRAKCRTVEPLPVTEKAHQALLRLPFYTSIEESEQERVVERLTAYFAEAER